MDASQNIQAEQYEFPYHYLPVYEQHSMRLTRQWNWATNYLAALNLVSDWMRSLNVTSVQTWKHIDIGCGDGALIYHLDRMFADTKGLFWVGIDYDSKAIKWARMLNGPRTEFVDGDLAKDYPPEGCDSATLIEVAEHIPPEQLPSFVAAINAVLKPGGELLVTVPHANRTVQKKHFQHFSFDLLNDYFTPHFELVSIQGFAKHTKFSKWLQRMIMNRTYVFTWEPLAQLVIRQLAKRYDENRDVSRIVAIFRKPDHT
jgi:SAM-dependent methyltransferase